jgi:heterodisulfide reductase subunit A-like polyferredoxin
LKNIKALPNPAQIVNSSYFAQVDADQCTACGTCEEYCPMDAIDIEETARINRKRCIGCGVCAAFCDVEAIALQAKPEADRWVPPANIVETYVNIAKERGKI